MNKKGAYAVTTFDQSDDLYEGMSVNIKIPFESHQLKGNIVKSKMWAEGERTYIPLSIDSGAIQALPFQNELICTGEIVKDNSTLVFKVLRNKTGTK